MIIPPFTLLIVKKAHRPITVRITGWFVLIVLMSGIILIAAGTYAVTRLLPETTQTPENESIQHTETTEYVLHIDPPDTGEGTAELSIQPDITEFSVSQQQNGDVVCAFTFENTSADEAVYLWIMVNPLADDPENTAIYPRTPLFQGLPVDYRNGIRHIPQNGHQLRLTFSGPEAGVTLEQFRVLAYSSSGDLIIDKTLTVQQNIRM